MLFIKFFILLLLPQLISSCIAGEYVDHGCWPCPTGCATCTSGTSCGSCLSGYYLSGVCQTCVSPCTACTSATVCSACDNGYYINGSTCTLCSSPCQYCSNASTCTTCISGYYLSGSSCLPCTKPCLECSSNATNCSSCVDSSNQSITSCNCNSLTKYVDSLNNYYCSNCQSPCINCTALNTCSSCISTYYLSGTTCLQCTKPCNECTGSATNCTSCVDATNQSTSSCACTSLSQYIDNTNNFYCSNCSSPCQNCSNATTCTTCISGYYLSGTSCLPCTKPCLECSSNATNCTSCVDTTHQSITSCACQSGYILDSTTYTCNQCTFPCATCSNTQTNCQSCSSNYTLQSNNTCSCLSTQLQQTNPTSLCVNCDSPCLTCVTSSTYCTDCLSGLNRHLSNNQCICDDGYFENNGICVACTLPCTKCTSASICLECNDISYQQLSDCSCVIGRYVNSSKLCDLCPTECSACSDSTNCSSCVSNYYLTINSTCLACVLPCLDCVDNDSKCTSCANTSHQNLTNYQCVCEDGYFMDANYYCQLCTHPCSKCSGTATNCTDCVLPFNYSGLNTCLCSSGQYEDTTTTISTCQNCVSPCATCITNQDYCQSCVDTHQVLNSNNQCICDIGYVANGNSCDQCILPCTQCQNTQTECTQCIDQNQIIINNQCVCKSGYVSNGINCIFCLYPCLECQTNSYTCTSCIDQSLFILIDGKCKCQTGYFQQNDQCIKCSPQCSACQDQQDNCLACSHQSLIIMINECTCQIGYYLNTIYQCQKCQSPCATCEYNYDYCTSCIDDLQNLQNNMCICQSGYYSNNSECKQCKNICNTCQSESICNSCIDGYYLDSQICINCPTQCELCSSINFCSQCKDGYYLNSSNQCIMCVQYCSLCYDSLGCQQCFDGYYLEDSQCKVCSSDCLQCQTTFDFCISCRTNYQLVSGQCICGAGYYETQNECLQCKYPCIQCQNDQFCEICASLNYLNLNQFNTCVCQDGYFWNNSQCLACDSTCSTCIITSMNCLSCNSIDHRIININKCVCENNYFEDDNKNCLSCNTEQGKVTKSCNYKDCTDFVWTYGEQCDDGNNISRDGCSNCQIDKGYSCVKIILQKSQCQFCTQNCKNCQTNQLTNIATCIECNSEYYLDQEQCIKCNERCLDCSNQLNCLTCRYLKSVKGDCLLCEEKLGYYTNKELGICQTKCGDQIVSDNEECDDGNNLNGDGCNSQCKNEKKFTCKNNICIEPEFPIPILSIEGNPTIYDPNREFLLSYNTNLQVNQEFSIQKAIQLFIEDEFLQIKVIQYKYQIEDNSIKISDGITEFKAKISLTLNKTSYNEKLLIKFQDYQKIISKEGYSQQIESIKIDIFEFQMIDQSTVQSVQTINSITENLLYIFLIIAGVALIFGGLDIIYNLLDTIQMLSYLKYVNVEFPYNLQAFFNFFGFAQLNYAQKYFNIQEMIDPYIQFENLTPAPLKISNDGYTCLFLINGTSILTVWFSLFGLYILARIIPKILEKIRFKYYSDNYEKESFIQKIKCYILIVKIFIVQLCVNFEKEFFYSAIIRTIMTTAYDYTFGLVLQLYAFDLVSQDIWVGISSFLSLLGLVVYLYLIFISVVIVGKNHLVFKSETLRCQFGSIYEGIKIKRYSLFYNIFLLSKKLIFMIILIFTYQVPLIQVTNLLLLSVLSVLYLEVIQPLEDPNESKKQKSCEINTAITLFFIVLLVRDKELQQFDYASRQIIGWICIVLISSILMIQFIIDVIQQWKSLYKKYKSVRKTIEKLSNLFSKKDNQSKNQKSPMFINANNFRQNLVLFQ